MWEPEILHTRVIYPSLLGGHPGVGAHLSRNDHSESPNANPIFNTTAEDPDASDSDEEPPELPALSIRG